MNLYMNFTSLLSDLSEIWWGTVDVVLPGVCECRSIGIVRTSKRYDIRKVGSTSVKSMHHVRKHTICSLVVTEIECIYRAVRADFLYNSCYIRP
jgi:hypothetical protein